MVSYDGTVAIPQSAFFPTRSEGISKLNEILCSLLLGGIHTEVLHSHELEVGQLYEKTTIFSYTPSLHARLRLNWASITECVEPLMSPRVLYFENIKKAFFEGQNIIQSLPRFTPFFLLNGYTSLTNQNNSDALNNLWIVVEQLTEILWQDNYLKNLSGYGANVNKRHHKLQSKIDLNVISAKHELLTLSKVIQNRLYQSLKQVRRARNGLAHGGISPTREVIVELWNVLLELFEITMGHQNIGMRALKIGGEIDWDIPSSTNFDEWRELVTLIK